MPNLQYLFYKFKRNHLYSITLIQNTLDTQDISSKVHHIMMYKILANSLLVFLFLGISLVACQEICGTDPWLTPIPNLNSAMEGFDPFMSDPFVNPDPGARNQIFEPMHYLPDGKLGVNGFLDRAREDIHCDSEFFGKTLKNYESYRAEKSSSYTFSEEKSKSFFSKSRGRGTEESSSEQSLIEFYKEGEGEVVTVKVECITHSVGISPFHKPKFTEAFEYALRYLHLAATRPGYEEDSEIFAKFVATYGTHFMQNTYLGARLVYEKRFANRSVNANAQQEREECVAESAQRSSGVGTRLFGGASSFQKSSKECGSSSTGASQGKSGSFESKKIVTIGSLPSSTFQLWAESAKLSPVPIRFMLEKISTLFKPEWINTIPLDVQYPHRENLNATALYNYFEGKSEEYCEIITGEECNFADKGCGINSDCSVGTTCINIDNKNHTDGYMCLKPYGKYIC